METNLRGTLRIAVWLGAILLANPAAANWNTIFEDDFESGEISPSRWNAQRSNPQEGIVLAEASQGDPVHSGEFGVRFKLALTDPADEFGKRRSELLPRLSLEKPAYYANFGPLYRYEFSIRLPEDWSPDVPEVVAQWHGTVDRDSEGDPIEPRRSPPISLRMTYLETSPGSGQYVPAWDARLRWDAHAETESDMSTVTSMHLLDPMEATDDLGKWVDWALEVRWDWDPNGVGVARLYKDGVLLAEHTGPNAFNDDLGPNSKIGLYKWDWDYGDVQVRVAHYDDVRIMRAAREIPISSWPGVSLLALSLVVVALLPARWTRAAL